MSGKRLFVISVDALFSEDLEYAATRKHLGPWLEHASGCECTKSIYPTVTYPNHVSMMTGCYADRHGIYTNYMFSTDGDGHSHWYWDGRYIKVDTIFTAAKRAGYTTACGFWPVTCNLKDIDWNMPEYWLSHDGDTVENFFPANGANEQVMEIALANKWRLRPGVVKNIDCQPEYDDWIVGIDCDIIRKYKPEVYLTHWSIVDTFRHKFGIDHPKHFEAIDHVDEWFGKICDALKEAGVYEDTDIVITSDHGQMDCERLSKVNAFLADKGLITLDENGKVVDYVGMIVSDGMCASVYLKNPDSEADKKLVYDTLKEMADIGIYGISEVLTKEYVQEHEHMDGPFSFVIETDGYTSYMDGFVPPYVVRNDKTATKDHRYGRGSHGFLPHKGPRPMFRCAGPHIVPDVILPEHCVVDEAPTYAALLGAELPEAQGKPMTELLKLD